MRRSLLILIAGAMIIALTNGCYATSTSAKKVPTWVMMNTMAKGQVVKPYEQTYTRWYVLWGLVPLGSPDVEGDMTAALKSSGAKYLDSVQVDTAMSFPMVLLNMITGMISVYNQQITVTGNLKR